MIGAEAVLRGEGQRSGNPNTESWDASDPLGQTVNGTARPNPERKNTFPSPSVAIEKIETSQA